MDDPRETWRPHHPEVLGPRGTMPGGHHLRPAPGPDDRERRGHPLEHERVRLPGRPAGGPGAGHQGTEDGAAGARLRRHRPRRNHPAPRAGDPRGRAFRRVAGILRLGLAPRSGGEGGSRLSPQRPHHHRRPAAQDLPQQRGPQVHPLRQHLVVHGARRHPGRARGVVSEAGTLHRHRGRRATLLGPCQAGRVRRARHPRRRPRRAHGHRGGRGRGHHQHGRSAVGHVHPLGPHGPTRRSSTSPRASSTRGSRPKTSNAGS